MTKTISLEKIYAVKELIRREYSFRQINQSIQLQFKHGIKFELYKKIKDDLSNEKEKVRIVIELPKIIAESIEKGIQKGRWLNINDAIIDLFRKYINNEE